MSRRTPTGEIDRADVHHRPARSVTVSVDEPDRASARIQHILTERTRRMAKAAADRTTEKTVALLVCRVGTERYALPLAEVVEVATLGTLALPPRSPPALLGAMNLRGVIYRVFDLGRLIALEGSAEPGGHVVILRSRGFPTGLRVDRAEGIVSLPGDRLTRSDAADCGNRFTENVVDGLLILDPNKIKDRIAGQGK
ncbi:MAG: chemotaxis protein CheW [Rhodospirillaceae bacterium]